MSELKLCPNPWCESDPAVKKYQSPIKSLPLFYEVRCQFCGVHTPGVEQKEQAIEIWNTRAAPKELTDILRTFYEVANQWGDPFEPREKYNEMVGRAMEKHEEVIKAALAKYKETET